VLPETCPHLCLPTNACIALMTWAFVDRLREMVKGKLVLKGIMTGEDAKEAMRHSVDAVQASNHGGRAEESGQATIAVLVEVVDAVNGRIPVLIDGGVRRGTDVLKALALGATAVGIGRPYVWGLASFGAWTACFKSSTMSSSRSCGRRAR
jgi:4-hydroxymandelate oxidase